MDGIFFGIFEIAFLLSSFYMIAKCTCTPPRPPNYQMFEYYVMPPEYTPTEKSPIVQSQPIMQSQPMQSQPMQSQPMQSQPSKLINI